MSVEDSQGNPKPLADAVPCKTRREFIEYGVQQAGWTVLVLALVAAACVWVLPLSLLGMLLVPVLSGPLPLALTFFDVSNEQLLWLTIVVAAGYWGLLGAVAGLAGWNAFAFEWKEQSLETLRQGFRRTRFVLFVMAFVGAVFAGFLTPSFMGGYRARSPRVQILNNLHQIQSAIQVYAQDHQLAADAPVKEADLARYLGRAVPKVATERYVLKTVGEDPYAVLEADWRIRRHGLTEGVTIPKGTEFHLR